MPGRFRPVAFDPYGRRRRSMRLMPPWLALLLAGLALGVAGVLYVQERVLPPRLSPAESVALQKAFDEADAERKRLAAELGTTKTALDAALAKNKSLADEAAGHRKTVEALRADVQMVVAALPPDPRGGAVEVRAARFSAERGQLAYDLVLSRERAAKPLAGLVQFVVDGETGRGAKDSVKLEPIQVSLGAVEGVRGSIALPEGFKAQRATVHVLERDGGKRLGMRVINVK